MDKKIYKNSNSYVLKTEQIVNDYPVNIVEYYCLPTIPRAPVRGSSMKRREAMNPDLVLLQLEEMLKETSLVELKEEKESEEPKLKKKKSQWTWGKLFQKKA